MPAPVITLKGKDYTANKPTVGIWRKLVKFRSEPAKDILQDEQAYSDLLGLLVHCFGHPEVTVQAIEDGLPLDELVPKIQEVTAWVGSLVMEKTAQLPNAQTPMGS